MRLVQVAQHADDLARASAFYTGLLGRGPSASFDPPGLVFFDLDGTRLLLERAAPSSLVYLAVPDVAVAVERVRSGGTAVETEPHMIFRHDDGTLGPAGHEEWQAFVRDTEGNLVGLVEHRWVRPA